MRNISSHDLTFHKYEYTNILLNFRVYNLYKIWDSPFCYSTCILSFNSKWRILFLLFFYCLPYLTDISLSLSIFASRELRLSDLRPLKKRYPTPLISTVLHMLNNCIKIVPTYRNIYLCVT